ncbi:MAG: murein L,D-transpeptidase catalytic domain family protein [Elusimicrobiaceae bacterium]|nr:murein L,D-transpeptidase catalytic domain family protein [Elusimicrobiaceae bacterium]
MVYSTICAHGCGGNSTLMQVDFSNKPGSNCSSIGRYRLGIVRTMYNHKKIPCIEVSGLDSTCSNAHDRGILIHPSIAQFSTWPVPMFHRTKGCFGLSWRGFKKIKQFKSQTSKPILLWAYK